MSNRKITIHAAERRRRDLERQRRAPGRSFYATSRWRELRRSFLARNPVCGHCGAPARHVDHVRPHRGAEALFFDVRNLYPLCHSCHSRKTVYTDGGFGRPVRASSTVPFGRDAGCSADGEPLWDAHPWNTRKRGA